MSFDEKYDDFTLLSLLAENSEYAFQVLFDRYRNHIYKVSMLYVKSPVIAEEVVQDVFLKLWFQRKNLNQIRSLESWLFTLTKNLTFNCLKKIAYEWSVREKWVRENAISENTSDYKLLEAQYQLILNQAIETLSPQQQLVYKMSKEQNLTYESIGEQLSISPLTVKTHMARALAAIRLYLEQQGIVPAFFIIVCVL